MVKVKLAVLLAGRGMSRAELARQTGIRANTIGELYNNLAERVSLKHLERICSVLDCSPGELLVLVPTKQ